MAQARGLDVETDRNGIIWAWWDLPSRDRASALHAILAADADPVNATGHPDEAVIQVQA